MILFGFLVWILPLSEMDLIAQFSAGQFTSTPVLVAPLLAVLVAGRLGSPIRSAQLVGLVGLAWLWVYRIFTSLGGRLPQVNLRPD